MLVYKGHKNPVIFVGVVAAIVRGKLFGLSSKDCWLNSFVFLISMAIKNTEDNGTTKKDPASSDLLNDGEQ